MSPCPGKSDSLLQTMDCSVRGVVGVAAAVEEVEEVLVDDVFDAEELVDDVFDVEEVDEDVEGLGLGQLSALPRRRRDT